MATLVEILPESGKVVVASPENVERAMTYAEDHDIDWVQVHSMVDSSCLYVVDVDRVGFWFDAPH